MLTAAYDQMIPLHVSFSSDLLCAVLVLTCGKVWNYGWLAFEEKSERYYFIKIILFNRAA